MNISVVIPVYRGEDTLEPLAEQLVEILPKVAEQYEIIFVNDGSPDNSWEVITRLCKQYACVRGIELRRNYGQHNAVLCGVRAARYEITVTMDDDLQHPPDEIPLLLEKLGDGYDVVYGVPRKMPHSWWRNIFSSFTKRAISYVMGFRTVRDISSFRALRTDLREAFHSFSGPDVLLDVLLSWGTLRFVTVPVDEVPRTIGHSNYNFIKLVRVALLVLTSFTTIPLRFASITGFVFTFIGLIIFFYVIISYFVGGSIPGFPFLASTITIFSGVQLFALGIIGEYLARVFERTRGRPPYSVWRTSDGQGEELHPK
jgi:glycosyltransferase involved in cell wall biosynthesis